MAGATHPGSSTQALPQPPPPAVVPVAPPNSMIDAVMVFAKSLFFAFFSPTRLWSMAIAGVVGLIAFCWALISGGPLVETGVVGHW